MDRRVIPDWQDRREFPVEWVSLGALVIRDRQVQRGPVIREATPALRDLWVLLVSRVRLVTPDLKGLRVDLAVQELVGLLDRADSPAMLACKATSVPLARRERQDSLVQVERLADQAVPETPALPVMTANLEVQEALGRKVLLA